MNLAHKQNRSLYSVFKDLDQIEELNDISSDSRATIPKLTNDLNDYLELSRNTITGVVLYQFIQNTNYLKRLTQNPSVENNIKVQNIAKFFDVVWSFSQVVAEDRVIHFVRYLDLLIEAGDDPGMAEADPDTDAVNVLTVHKAKGLEWPVVFMVSLLHNRFPHTRRRDPIELPDALIKEVLPEGDAHLQEERRLFYVGMTRAKDRIYLTSAEDYGGVRKRKVSPFVLEALDRPKIEGVNVKAKPEERIHRFAPVQEGSQKNLAPIPEKEILNLSYYQVDDYLTCPLKYKYVHILRVPILPHHTVIYGKALHQAVERYYRHKMNGSPVTLKELLQAYENAWNNVGFLSREHEDRRHEAGITAIRTFFEQEEKSAIIPKMVEEKFSFIQNNNRISGRWDRVDERDGGIVIVDFKSSEVHQQDAADDRTKNSLQMAIYAAGYAKAYERPPDSVELHFMESGLVGTAPVTEKMLSKTEDKIREAASGIRLRDYTAKPGYQACKYCAYVEVCPSAMNF
jgi:DNA helicase-2/ATP-dependent DNA helicase PcrA